MRVLAQVSCNVHGLPFSPVMKFSCFQFLHSESLNLKLIQYKFNQPTYHAYDNSWQPVYMHTGHILAVDQYVVEPHRK